MILFYEGGQDAQRNLVTSRDLLKVLKVSVHF